MPTPLPAEQLYRRCDAAGLRFATTAELPDISEPVGQGRAVDAVRFGIRIRRYGYNIYALGPPGMGKHGLVRQFLETSASQVPTPSDWCYVHNFRDPRRPRALRLPAGRAEAFRLDMERLVEELRVAIPTALESDDYRARRKLIESQFGERSEQLFGTIERRAREQGIALVRTPVGVGLAPRREDGEVIEPDELERLPENERERLGAAMAELQEQLQEALAQLPREARRQREALRGLRREVTGFAVGHLIDELRAAYAGLPEVLEHLDAVQQDVVESTDDFKAEAHDEPDVLAALLPKRRAARPFRRYQVNVLVDHSRTQGAPVVYEDHPTHPNLVGRVEHLSEFGSLTTDFLLVRGGALHRASGGYLLLDARKLLMQPMAWDELKRALRSGQVRVESLGQALGLLATASVEPEPIPLDIKVVLVGDRLLYYLLADLDPDFLELFKVAADFEETLDRDAEGEALYARLLATLARRESLRPLEPGAVARVIEHGSRLASDSEKLSVHLESLADVLRQADHVASESGRERVERADVDTAIEAQVRRMSRVSDRMLEEIRRGTILIDTGGSRVGQVNGLSVVQLGGYLFGRPSRITARVRLGSGRVLDIEREVRLGGPIHSKGVLILSGFLGERYAAERPLSLHASLVFEQSYGGVEGDSASCAELVALLSAIAEAPVRQDLALTGSVNQQGEVQAVGGVTEKIEGFFDVCNAAGLSGEQGVLIPAANVKHLMLRRDVVEAVESGRFRVYAIRTVDEALELLTGLPAGARDGGGEFPEGSLNRRVEARLSGFAEKARAFAKPAE
ncbi:MAG TPA: AAA family ATPase [Vicinamibacteria bacterium]|nr:AAA family ATPase [Vicinamibacteria bacterium]